MTQTLRQQRVPATPAEALTSRPEARGKFLFVGERKLPVRGVTYGAFQPDGEGREYQDRSRLDDDFAMMAAYGFNAVRIPHTMPPPELLDVAQKHGLRVMVGLSAEQYVGYLIDRREAPDVVRLVAEKARTVAGHPALLCYGIGNEIPASLARWIGRHSLEQYLRRLYDVVKAIDPGGLVTYVNYPSTEYLSLPFLDLLSFNVYLEQRAALERYLARLQNLAGDRPLLLTELGLDSLRNGEAGQAESLEWQLEACSDAGASGTFIFSWTDEWWRGGAAVQDWKFGLTTESREPKPALDTVCRTFERLEHGERADPPRVSVVVCTFNGSRTIAECLQGALAIDYPDFEVIVVDDGSTDDTATIVERLPVRLVRTPNRGLSSARNTGLSEASGDIVAYLDDDAFPDPDWLRYLVDAFERDRVAAVGGPNLPPPGELGLIADCVADAPGGPAHVLLTDTVAEHIPGCNMAFLKSELEAAGGFDPMFRKAGDDVDICWRIQERGARIGFHAAALVWHRRRASLLGYWRQQSGYGEAEALLERKWPEKYNALGHVGWGGRVYHSGLTLPLPLKRFRVYHGVWGMAPFQSIHQPAPGLLLSLPLLPEWYLLALFLVVLSLLGLLWKPLLVAAPFALLALALPVIQAGHSAWRGSLARRSHARWRKLAVTTALHLLHPAARLWGRLRHGLTPWRNPGTRGTVWPRRFELAHWSEHWIEPAERLSRLERELRCHGAPVRRGGAFDDWDFEVQTMPFGAARCLMAFEDHGSGTQLVRFRGWTRPKLRYVSVTVLLAGLAIASALSGVMLPAAALGIIAVLLGGLHLRALAVGAAILRQAAATVLRDAPETAAAGEHAESPDDPAQPAGEETPAGDDTNGSTLRSRSWPGLGGSQPGRLPAERHVRST